MCVERETRNRQEEKGERERSCCVIRQCPIGIKSKNACFKDDTKCRKSHFSICSMFAKKKRAKNIMGLVVRRSDIFDQLAFNNDARLFLKCFSINMSTWYRSHFISKSKEKCKSVNHHTLAGSEHILPTCI